MKVKAKLKENENLTQTSLYMDSGLIRAAKIVGAYEGKSMSKMISKLVEQYVINFEKKHGKLL